MTLIISISDYWRNKTYYKIAPTKSLSSSNDNSRTAYKLEILPAVRNADSRRPVVAQRRKKYKCAIDGIQFFYLNKELVHFSEYRRLLCIRMHDKGLELLRLQIVPPESEIIDWKWNQMLALTLWDKIETVYLMSWLSTLGGAFSALGEQFSACAEMAGKISQKQLRIGIKLDDPFLQCRCKLFYSISLIQTGRLRSAKYLIREQYQFARRHKEVDGRLVKMCKGIWIKLQYEYGRRIKARKKELPLNYETIKEM